MVNLSDRTDWGIRATTPGGKSNYVLDDPKPGFEQYPPGTESGDSPVFIHVPLRARLAE